MSASPFSADSGNFETADSSESKLRCHCGRFSWDYSSKRVIPSLNAPICNCDVCRHNSGQLCTTFMAMNDEAGNSQQYPNLPSALRQLQKYNLSAKRTKYFCMNCGTSVFLVDVDDQSGLLSKLQCATGLLPRANVEALSRYHEFLGSSEDGGAAVWFPSEVNGKPIRYYIGSPQDAELSGEALQAIKFRGLALANKSPDERLNAKCHCGAVQMYIVRPDEAKTEAKAGSRRFLANLCMCTSCRLTTGWEITFWAGLPPDRIYAVSGSPYDLSDPALGCYQSSEGVYRYFCKACGAAVIYRNSERQPVQWDIAVGLFRDTTTRAESWLEWDPKIYYIEDALDRNLAGGITVG